MQAIVVTFDRLATRLLGCYGNEWIETPNFDRLATTSAVFDDHFVDTVGAHRGQAWLTGRHALQQSVATANLGDSLRAAGVKTRIVASDRAHISGFTKANVDLCQSVNGTDGLEANPNDVPFAKLVQAGVAALNDKTFQSERRLLWLHAPEPGLPPEGFATLYFEDFEEREAPVAEVPREDWGKQLAVAAGSVSLVDHWLGVLLQELEANSNDQPTLILIAAAGGRAWMDEFISATPTVKGDAPVTRLRDQETKSPLIVSVRHDERYRRLASIRSQQFVQSTDVLPTLLDWFTPSTNTEDFLQESLLRIPLYERNHRDAIIFGDEEHCLGIRTRQWGCLARVSDPKHRIVNPEQFDEQDWPEQVQLFIKPDDIWDVTDISSQYPEICHRLLTHLDAIRRVETGN